jgi:hypothetical protein
VTNELGQIWICDLVATKSHSQFEHHLAQVQEPLDLYGHSQPEVFYTDDMKQQGLLTSAFCSLLKEVVPVEKYSNLEKMSFPPDIFIHTRSTSQGINDAICSIMESAGNSNTIAVGFDIEWDVDLSLGGGKQGVVSGHELLTMP